ncbi:hypothetical protein ABBQ38_004260 [Trebouxia sp. C0009 RCD-2024]
MSSSDDEATSNWTPLSQRPEWKDVQPVAQPDSLQAVVAIQYTTQAEETLSYFRAVRAAKELSPRALDLTQEVIYINSADYTAWAYRWQCLEAVGGLDDEMRFINEMASRSPKNYQLWNHRRRLAFKRGADYAQEELKYAAECLAEDAKNYHAWAHRQAIVRQFGLWQQELDVVSELLQEDVRNNSAWNQRFFILSEATHRLFGSPTQESMFVQDRIVACPHNESSWNYLRGLLSLPDMKQALVLQELAAFCVKVSTAYCWMLVMATAPQISV